MQDGGEKQEKRIQVVMVMGSPLSLIYGGMEVTKTAFHGTRSGA
jgi:hypothetical protein